MKRRRLGRRKASAIFKRGAKVHRLNVKRKPSRGGIRL